MSNPQVLISETDSEYWKFRHLIEGCLKKTKDASGLSEREAIGMFEEATKFQRFLESKTSSDEDVQRDFLL